MNKYEFDLEDINYCILHEDKNEYFIVKRYTKSYFRLFANILKIFAKSLYGLFVFIFSKKQALNHIDYLFYYISENNKRALAPIQAIVNNSGLMGVNDLRIKESWRFAILFLPYILKKYSKAKGYYKKAYTSELVELCTTYSYYKNAIANLKEIKPKFLILANDHIALCRSYIKVAHELGIKTIYIQHASTSSKFPPLNFTYAFLDGLESYEIYLSVGKCLSEVFLSGGSRFDMISKIQRDGDISDDAKLGISINLADSLEKVKYAIDKITKELPYLKIEIRPHPAMDFERFIKYFNYDFITFSNPKEESPYIFIARNNLFIAGESSMHLDTVLLNKVSFYYNFTEFTTDVTSSYDMYKYIEKGLIIDITPNIIYYLKSSMGSHKNQYLPSIAKRRYFVENFETNYWGYSTQLIAKTLVSLIDNRKLENWEKLDGLFYLNKKSKP